MLIAQLAQALHEAGGGGVEAPFTLHRFDDDGGHPGRFDIRAEAEIQRGQRIGLAHSQIVAWEGQVIDLAREGAETGLVGHHLAGERHPHHGAAVKAPLEGDGAAAAGVGAGDLDGVLYRLGAGGEKQGAFRGGAGHQGIQLLRQLDIAGVGGDLEAGVAELLQLRAHRCHHFRVVVAGVEHGDAGGKIDVAVALHIPQLGVLRPLDKHRQQGADAVDYGRFTARLPRLV